MLYKPTILFADSNQKFATYFTILLGRMGFDVISVSNGTDAVTLSQIFNIDLIIMETKLPEIDGWAVLNYLKNNGDLSNIPVVIFTADPSEGTRKKFLNAGVCGYISKPADVLSLYRAIQDCIVYSKGTKREHLRINTEAEIILNYEGIRKHCLATTISEGGVYIKSKNILPEGTKIEITLPFTPDVKTALSGTVLYTKSSANKGMAVAFQKVPGRYASKLRGYILDLLLRDIIDKIGGEVTMSNKKNNKARLAAA